MEGSVNLDNNGEYCISAGNNFGASNLQPSETLNIGGRSDGTDIVASVIIDSRSDINFSSSEPNEDPELKF